MPRFADAQYLNWDIPVDRTVLLRRSWNPRARLLVFDEIQRMPDWKAWLKGVIDARADGQALLVTGSARMEAFRQAGESLAGLYLALRLHPVSVRDWCEQQQAAPDAALDRLLQRGGFPEPLLADGDDAGQRWRRQYAVDLIREEVVEFLRLTATSASWPKRSRAQRGSRAAWASMPASPMARRASWWMCRG